MTRIHFFFWPCRAACGISVFWPGIKPGPMAVKSWSPKHWTARKFPKNTLLLKNRGKTKNFFLLDSSSLFPSSEVSVIVDLGNFLLYICRGLKIHPQLFDTILQKVKTNPPHLKCRRYLVTCFQSIEWSRSGGLWCLRSGLEWCWVFLLFLALWDHLLWGEASCHVARILKKP